MGKKSRKAIEYYCKSAADDTYAGRIFNVNRSGQRVQLSLFVVGGWHFYSLRRHNVEKKKAGAFVRGPPAINDPHDYNLVS